MDHSLLRNRLALSVARRMSFAWTPDCRIVDVVVNGKVRGCYTLCEQVCVAVGRVYISGRNSFLVEADAYRDEDYRFETNLRKLPISVKYPKTPTRRQMENIAGYLDRIESLLYGNAACDAGALFGEYIDLDSFVDWWLMQELSQNAEPNGPRSCYMYKDGRGLLRAGPVWDFDLAFINVGLDMRGDLRPSRLNRKDVVNLTGDSLYNRNALWYDRLLRDSVFCHRLRDRWNELAPVMPAYADSIDKWSREMEQSAMADAKLWKDRDPARFDTITDWRASVANLKKTYIYRVRRLGNLLSILSE